MFRSISAHSVPRVAAVAALALGTVLGALPAAAAPVNLIRNGDAEAAAGVDDDQSVAAVVPEWTRAVGSKATTVRYGAAGGFPLAADGPPDGGRNFFAGGPTTLNTEFTQFIDLTGYAGRNFTLSGWFGGWQMQNDDATLIATFIDAQQQEITMESIGSVTAAERSGATGLLLRTVDGVIPDHATGLQLVLRMRYSSGLAYNDGYADNLAFTVHELPEPGSAALLLAAGVAGGGWRSARRGARQGRVN